MTPNIDMNEATRLTRLGRLTEAMAVLRGDKPVNPEAATATKDTCIEMTQTPEGAWSASEAGAGQARRAGPAREAKPRIDLKDLVGKFRAPLKAGRDQASIPPGARFTDHVLGHGLGGCFKLYVPSTYAGEGAALVVMLHGCTQSPDDFAAGTGMNSLAEASGFLVLYPEQSTAANMNRCWNWFKDGDQCRDQGEPRLLVEMVKQVVTDHAVDSRKVFVAGLSAGGAMAAILGARYPDVFSAVGVHSGLAVGAAHDMPSAFAAMSQGSARIAPLRASGTVPTIVFHGDADATVHGQNGHQVVEQALNGRSLDQTTSSGQADGGRRYSRTVYRNPDGSSAVEQWVVHGAGHAWSGGHAAGSYTDGRGPDASREMVRFFLDAG